MAGPEGEQDQLRDWLIYRLEALGVFSRFECELLVDDGADVRLLERLLAAGCPARLATRII